MSSLTLCSMRDPWAQNEPKDCIQRKGPHSFCVSEIERIQSTFANQCRPDEVPSEVAPCEEWLPEEVELNTVTISNMSIDSKPVEIDGKRCRYREITVDSGAGESVVNPDEWPNVDLKPSKGSVKGQRYVGPGCEKIDNFGELTDTPYRTTQRGRHLKSSDISWSQSPPWLAVLEVIDKGNIVVFDGNRFFYCHSNVLVWLL